MEYKGKLYGKVGSVLIPLHATTDDWDKMEEKIKIIEAENEAIKQANGAKSENGKLPIPPVIDGSKSVL